MTSIPDGADPSPEVRPAPPVEASGAGGREAMIARPWPRYWARSFDVLLFALICGLIAGVVFRGAFDPGSPLVRPGGKLVVGIAGMPVVMLLDSVFYWVFKNTPGKWLGGIRILDTAGKPLRPLHYLRRNFSLYYAGIGCGIPIVALFTLIHSFNKAKRGEELRWDNGRTSRSLQVREGRWRTYVTAACYLTLLLGTITLSRVESSPSALLAATAWAANKTTPKMINSVTRIDRVESLPGLAIQFDVSLLNVSASHVDRAVLNAGFQGEVRQKLKKVVCMSPGTKFFRDIGATVRYQYFDKSGVPLAVVEIPTRECLQHH